MFETISFMIHFTLLLHVLRFWRDYFSAECDKFKCLKIYFILLRFSFFLKQNESSLHYLFPITEFKKSIFGLVY